MSLDIQEEALIPVALSEHAAIPLAFPVDQSLHVGLLDGGLGGLSLTETAVTDPYVKDYDAIEGAGRSAGRGALTSRTPDSSPRAGTAQAPAVP